MRLGKIMSDADDQLAQLGIKLPGALVTFGIGSWLLLGIAAAFAIAGWLFVYSASISIPLLLALVIGMIAYPLCEKMAHRGMPKAGAAVIVLLLLTAILVAVAWLVVAGVLAQWPNIKLQLQQGLESLGDQLRLWGFDPEQIVNTIQKSITAAEQSGPEALTNGSLSDLGSTLAQGVSGVFNLFFSLFISATLLYYVLTDWPTIANWLSGHMFGLSRTVSEGIVEDAVAAMRGYFRGTTITGVTVATVIGLTMLLMGVPLAATVAIVTFLTCYIPFFGAIISGAFAFVIALGSNGLTTALILLAVVLLAQNVLQTVINARVMGDSLNLHPLVVLVVTMLGGIFGGLLGAALGAPVAALLVNAGKRLSSALRPAEGAPHPEAAPE